MMSENNEVVVCGSGRVTREGYSVLLDINDGDRLVFARLSDASTLKIGNKNYPLKPLIGCPFGSLFQAVDGSDGPHLSRFLHSMEGNNSEEKNNNLSNVESKDNREINDNNQAQNLTGEDIEAMKRQGASGDEIIEALIANSMTFEKKTVFSQEKYRLRKQKKYAPKVLLRRPFARSICEAYFKKHPARIGFLRVDTLSLLLSMANVSANSDILVVDMVGGLITGAVAERLGGAGYVCNAYLGRVPPSMDIVRIFNFGDEICKRIVRAPISDLSSSQKETAAEILQPADDEMSASVSNKENSLLSKNGESDVNLENSGVSVLRAFKPTKAGEKVPQEIIDLWMKNGFSSLIIAAPELDTWTIVNDLLPLLSNSAPFAIYHQYLQPLATCMHNLQIEKSALALQISEPWMREYQVLPSRTHPCMQMNAFGGYILSGIKICSSSS